MTNEKISIIVPVHNAEKYIEETVSSVLSQTYPDWELLLVENGSTDKTNDKLEEIMKWDKRIRVFHFTKGASAARARNEGLRYSEGRYIAFLDADDIWKSEKLKKELKFLKKHNAAFVFTGYEFADENGKPLGKIVRVPHTLNHKQAMKNTTIFTSTVMFDTVLIPKENLRMPEIKSEDTALWWQVLRGGIIAYGLDENLVLYRRPGKSLSSNKIEALRRIWNLYRKFEKLSIVKSAWYFVNWAVRAVFRRI